MIISHEKYLILNLQEKENLYAQETGTHSPFQIGIPLIDLSDKTIEEIYYFRWHTYCMHIKETPAGHVITEFLPPVPWAGIYNTICCPAGHHLYEGRWFHDQRYLTEYTKFWFSEGAEPRRYSFWAADAVIAVSEITGNYETAETLYENLKENYAAWETEKQMENGLFFQIDDRDGMEFSAGGSGIRPTINSYMYGDALALCKLAKRLGKKSDEQFYRAKAQPIKSGMDTLLWDTEAEFYKTLAEDKAYERASVRELIGYVPWYFNLPDADKSAAWKFLNDEDCFYAPYGPTTTERNCPDFMKKYDHECLWNGPSWPFATSQTLTALGNLLTNYEQTVMLKSDYFKLLKQYASCHYLTENGCTVPFIDENLDPFTGEWLARKILLENPDPNQVPERGKNYNHSTFCDLVLNGLAGIRAGEDNILEINPLFSPEDLDYFCADGILYHGHTISLLWDREGNRYSLGKGLHIYCDGKEVHISDTLNKVKISLT